MIAPTLFEAALTLHFLPLACCQVRTILSDGHHLLMMLFEGSDRSVASNSSAKRWRDSNHPATAGEVTVTVTATPSHTEPARLITIPQHRGALARKPAA